MFSKKVDRAIYIIMTDGTVVGGFFPQKNAFLYSTQVVLYGKFNY